MGLFLKYLKKTQIIHMTKKQFCVNCPFHNDVKLIHTELEDGTSEDYCPKCQELFGEKI